MAFNKRCICWTFSIIWILVTTKLFSPVFSVETGQCVTSCEGIPDGHYTSCDSCMEYVSCGGGVFFGNRPCTDCSESCDMLYWDDNLKYCTPTPTTCIPDQGRQELIGFWPLNCKYLARDLSGKGHSAEYDTGLTTAPSIECPAAQGLSGAVSFALTFSGDILTPVFLEVGTQDLTVAGFTWVGYIRMSQEVFTDEDVPIFAFERNSDWSGNLWAGLGIFWKNGNIALHLNRKSNSYSLDTGTGMTPNIWYKMAVRYISETGYISVRCSRLSDYLNTVNYGLPTTQGITAYTKGRIRFGLLPSENNGGNSNPFRGELSCVRLWNYGLSDADLYGTREWRTIPSECTDTGTSTTTTPQTDQECSSPNLCGDPGQAGAHGKEVAECIPTDTSYFCQCPDGYRWEEDLTMCVDVDESLVGNCGCEDVCTNKLVDRDGSKYQCDCSDSDKQLGPDGHKCIDKDEDMPGLKVWPLHGPRSGGTVIDIQDEDLSGTLEVYIGSIRLIANQLSTNHIQVTTLSLVDTDLLNVPQAFDLLLNGDKHASMTFTYMDDPVIASVEPLRAIAAGGTILTVKGEHLDSVANPVLSMVKEDTSGPITYTSRCEGVSSRVMQCPSPVVDSLTIHRQTRRRRQTEGERELADVYIGFELDGVEEYRDMRESNPDYAEVTVVMNPEIASFPGDGILDYDPTSGSKIDIRGEYMNQGATETDYTVMVEAEQCTHLEMFSTSVSCLPPSEPPQIQQTISTKDGLHHVMVHVGYYTFSLGYLKYIDKSTETAKKVGIYIGAAFGGLAVLAITLVVCYCCCCKKRKRSAYEDHHDFTFKKGMNMPPSLEAVDGTGNMYVKGKQADGKRKDYYSNDKNFDSDFGMKMRKKDAEDKMYGGSPGKADQDYEITFYDNDLYKKDGNYVTEQAQKREHDYLNMAGNGKQDYMNIDADKKVPDYLVVEEDKPGGNKPQKGDKTKEQPDSDKLKHNYINMQHFMAPDKPGKKKPGKLNKKKEKSGPDKVKPDYMNMEKSIPQGKPGNKPQKVDKKKQKSDSSKAKQSDQSYLAPSVYNENNEKTKGVSAGDKKPQGFINRTFESGAGDNVETNSSGAHFTRSDSIDVASAGGNEAMRRAQQVFGDFKKPGKKF